MVSRKIILTIVFYYVSFTLAEIPSALLRSGERNSVQERIVSYRLPNNTNPIRYDVTLITRIDNGDFNFNGIVQIEIVAMEATNFITLHQRQLVILTARLILPDTSVFQLTTFTYDPVTEFLTFDLTSIGVVLQLNNLYHLEIEYSGFLRTDTHGFYRSSYINENGITRWLATTQFEPTDARHAFPSYDEPSRKAIFDIRIMHGSTYTAISNMPVASVVTSGEITTTTFQSSVAMSTYLVAFVVSDFIYLSNNSTGTTIPQRVFARPAAREELHLGLEASERIIDALATYYGVPYSLPKMDQVASPDFPAGAMENWGLVIYREPYILFNETIHTYAVRTVNVIIVSHEIAHQWFGNLVSPLWWTYLWLNEGFANLYEHLGTDMAYPEWRIMEYYVVNSLQDILSSDSGNLRPMTYYVESPEEIENLFDVVAYQKAGAVLRMFQHAITESTFVKGLNHYLIARQFGSATQEDLFASLDQSVIEDSALPANLNIATLFISWSMQNGYPVLIVERNYEDGIVTITQERYQSSLNSAPNSAMYWIPYNFATANNFDFNDTSSTDWLSPNEQSRTMNIPDLAAGDWIIFNKQQTGYYRVHYDEENYNLIQNELTNGDINAIHLLNRAQIIDDLFNFGRTNRVNYDIVFNIITYLQNETEYAPWQSAINGLTYIDRMLVGDGEENYNSFRLFVSELIEELFTSVGIEDVANEQLLRKYSRTIAIQWACYMGLESCLSFTTDRTREFITTNQPIHQNVIESVLCGGLRDTNIDDYTAILNRLHSTVEETLRASLISSLGCSWDVAQLTIFLETSLSVVPTISYISPNERASVMTSVYQGSHIGLQISIEFLLNNSDAIYDTYGQNNLENIVIGISQRIPSGELRSTFESILHSLRSRGYISEEIVGRATHNIIENFQWIDLHQQHLYNWIERNSGASSLIISFILMILALVFTKFV